MRGYLKIVVLEELSKEEKTGYGLMDAVEASIGKRPSSGSIYPLLSDLTEKKLIKERRDGTKKWYSVTSKGKRSLKEFLAERETLIQHHLRVNSIFSEITGAKIKDKEFVKAPFIRNFDILSQLKEQIFRVVEDTHFRKKEAAFRRILKRTIKELRDI